jgi:hypothetical protein
LERFLPWGSDAIQQSEKLSPVRASALILNFLRGAWNTRFANAGADFDFDAQEITVTVPASFDAAAQNLTLLAAGEAGFPEKVRLLEEPQAAFMRWLEDPRSVGILNEHFPQAETVSVLVVDIGGGTSDFSLFDVAIGKADPLPPITRTAVSDHILLGGDNIDLAIAHIAETRLAESAGSLSAAQWDHLVARCRDMKERALGTEGSAEDLFTVAIPGRGSSLVASALSAQITRDEIDAILFDGFFPECERDDTPRRAKSGLKEWGLPYAADSAVTRHLAAFLNDNAPVDAVLFNGGSLYPPALRQRIAQTIGHWQNGRAPVVLENAEPDLAVARGAALFGKLHHQKTTWIEAGASRAVFVEAFRKPDKPIADESDKPPARTLICILPRGASPEVDFDIDDIGLELRTNRPVRFQPYSSTRHRKSRAGDILDLTGDDFHPLPPLETIAKLPDDQPETTRDTVPIGLVAKVNELGLLRVVCRSTDPDLEQSWPLEFNLRTSEPTTAGHVPDTKTQPVIAPNVAADAMDAGRTAITDAFVKPLGRKEKLSATRVQKTLEKVLKTPKNDWNWAVVRGMWSILEACMAQRGQSVEHEETWLILAGFFLRPGFGAPLDASRIDGLWKIRDSGLRFPGKRVQAQEYILWRRVAGGLSRERQERILAKEMKRLTTTANPQPELIRMAGALERIGHETKTELVNHFVSTAAMLARDRKHCAPYLAALETLLNRSPFYAGPEAVVSPELVEFAYGEFADLDWTDPELTNLQTLFMRAARVIDNRTLDVSKGSRQQIAAKLEKSGIPSQKTAKLKQFAPLEGSERSSLYGEALPPGLILAGD